MATPNKMAEMLRLIQRFFTQDTDYNETLDESVTFPDGVVISLKKSTTVNVAVPPQRVGSKDVTRNLLIKNLEQKPIQLILFTHIRHNSEDLVSLDSVSTDIDLKALQVLKYLQLQVSQSEDVQLR